ncbi:hypothetical protein SS1G_02456 [Sclerotinia sclerotiorum 1980 UF-70]|uniref:Transcription factor domain-containing protein n=1 Tax=Sclerotinia sclerotiorum (strain ATCC 18683 / 1980 / Ss-1) TaxID=665079 RepID=A7EAX1_SCLS1|nr:hypothetical protein SS1G_02456 [Sclerotinia sclerotiorum 1980 UF-70]EDN99599.1 hypothetical protein SS1G_02456 [Sclerotinia sclerotiorum 1980 UF-70]
MIIGPAIAEDVQVLEQYMESQSGPKTSKRGRLYDTVSDNPKDPVIYLSVSRRREGLSSSERPGEKQKEILEQILGPNVGEVVKLYGLCQYLVICAEFFSMETTQHHATSQQNALSYYSATHSSEQCLPEVRAYHHAMLRESAKAIITFLTSLTEQNLNEFWMPYSAYHICSATIILLRCAIDASDRETADSCMSCLSEVKQWLTWAYVTHHWDLAEICLAQCAEPIDRLNASSRSVAIDAQTGGAQAYSIGTGVEDLGDPASIPSLADTESFINGLEYPFVDLWDMFEQEYQ